MKVQMKKYLFCLVLITFFSIIPTVTTFAASETVAPAYNGKWTYYGSHDTIYKLNSKTGIAQEVVTLKDVYDISQISYYNNYLYFVANYEYGSDAENCYVCRIKTNGKDFQKLDHGSSPIITDKKIYYLKTEHYGENGSSYDLTLGLAQMSLNGKNSKLLTTTSQFNQSLLAAFSGKIYYIDRDDSSCDTLLMSYNTKNKKTSTIYKSSSEFYFFDSDATYLYLETYGDLHNDVYAYNVHTGDSIKKEFSANSYAFAAKNGIIYFFNSQKEATYTYNIKKDQIKTMSKNKRITGFIFSKYQFQVATYYAGNSSYDLVRIKLDGTGFKCLKKYHYFDS